jgi:4a-hydroxytetrahydrobiopterin dehydratase
MSNNSINNEYANMSCKLLGGCSKDTVQLSEDEIDKLINDFPLWRICKKKNDDNKSTTTSIKRSFTCKNWQSAIEFLNKMSEIAEEEQHHPDFTLSNYRDVSVILTTHAINALSKFDFILAAKIDLIDVTYSPKWATENLPK